MIFVSTLLNDELIDEWKEYSKYIKVTYVDYIASCLVTEREKNRQLSEALNNK